jgi:glycosyltransferase involved in cell wall biosynthesis
MHVLFVHQNFPAQFGHVAAYLAQRGHRCTFLSERPATPVAGMERMQYQVKGGARETNHYCSRTFENSIWHAHAIFEALKARPDVQPDLVVGHSGLGSVLFLRELYRCPVINYFEYYYHTSRSDMDFRPDFPTTELDRLRAQARNAMLLLDLENCDAGYCPTEWQRSKFPATFQSKLRVIFDGVDTDVWRRQPEPVDRRFGAVQFPGDKKLVTYVARGMESMRGFDIFLRIAKRLCDERRDVVVAVVGQDRVCYGGDLKHIQGSSFKDWVLRQDRYDLSRIHFLGLLPPTDLARLLSLSDLHVYLTVPFVLSWSLMDALACGCTVLASATDPVKEVIRDGENGLLVDFFDVDGFVAKSHQILNDPEAHRHLGQAGQRLIMERYSAAICLPKIEAFFARVAMANAAGGT